MQINGKPHSQGHPFCYFSGSFASLSQWLALFQSLAHCVLWETIEKDSHRRDYRRFRIDTDVEHGLTVSSQGNDFCKRFISQHFQRMAFDDEILGRP